MGTNYIAPIWRQPENLNKDKLSNYSINFGGSDYIDCGNDAFLNWGTGNGSVSCWFKTTQVVTGAVDLVINGGFSTGGKAYLLYLDGNEKVGFYLDDNASPTTPAQSSGSVADGNWHHVVGVRESGNIKLYLDGSLADTQTDSTGNIDSTDPLIIGAGMNASTGVVGNFFDGKISQVSIFDYALSTDQINYLYNLNNPMAISGAEPISYYPLGDNSNPTATAGYPNIVSSADSVFDFGTSNEEIDTPGPYTDGTQGDLTISAWVKQDSITTAYRPFICTGFTSSMTQPQIAMALRNVGGNRLYLFYNGGGGSNYIYAQNVMTEANRWYHCAFVRSGSTGKLYVDGQEVSTLNSADFSVSPQVTTADSEMTLGGWRYSGSNESLNGELSNVCLWKTALTDGVGGQIEELYNNGMPLLELSELPQNNNLLGWYKLNQSAILTPGVPTNWTITKIGSPNYGSSVDGCYVADNSNSTPTIYNTGGLIWHDNDSGTTVGSDYFQWNSPIIYTSGSNIVLSSSGGSYLDPYYGSQAILEYNIDNGSWVTWHTQTNGPGGFSANSFSIPSTGNLTVSNNIQIRIKGVDRGSNGSFLRINDVNATGGTSSYSENFNSNTTKYGFFANSETQPPATFSADNWDIPDNRSAYPQSFNFDNNPYILFSPNFYTVGSNKMQVSTVSWWMNSNRAGSYSVIFTFDANNSWMLRIDNSGNMWFFSGSGASYVKFQNVTGNSINLCDSKWHHCVFTIPDATDKTQCKFFIDNQEITSTITSGSAGGDGSLVMQELQLAGGYLGNIEGTVVSSVQAWLDIALDSSDIETLYNNGVPLPTNSVESDKLKGWWKLDNNDVWNPVLNQWEIIDYAN